MYSSKCQSEAEQKHTWRGPGLNGLGGPASRRSGDVECAAGCRATGNARLARFGRWRPLRRLLAGGSCCAIGRRRDWSLCSEHIHVIKAE